MAAEIVDIDRTFNPGDHVPVSVKQARTGHESRPVAIDADSRGRCGRRGAGRKWNYVLVPHVIAESQYGRAASSQLRLSVDRESVSSRRSRCGYDLRWGSTQRSG